MSTRFGNLKRHIGRKHGGIGNPILQYIVGNSIITSGEPVDMLQVFRDEYPIERHKTKPSSFRSNSSHIQYEDDWLNKWTDKYIEPILKFNEYQARMKSINQSLNPYPPPYFSQFTEQPHYSFRSPQFIAIEKDSVTQPKIAGFYDDVSGFKVDICTRCLTNLSAPISSNDFSFEDFHKCDPQRVDVITNMEPREYAMDTLRNVQNLPHVLFELCKEWASNTSGELYLTAKIDNGLNEGKCLSHEIQENDSFPLLKRVLSESKIKLTDTELLDFLRLAINQTKAIVTLRAGPGQASLKYLLVVSTV